jgi:hypothetical protein
VIEQVAPAGSEGAHVVVYGKSAVSLSASPMISAVVVESVIEAVAVSPMDVWGNASVAGLTESCVDGVVGLLQAVQKNVASKGSVRTTARD